MDKVKCEICKKYKQGEEKKGFAAICPSCLLKITGVVQNVNIKPSNN